MHAFSALVRYFEEVAEQKSIRRAAERLHIAPSAVTRQILKFEELLGTPLFERLPRGVRLTSAGEMMLANVRRMQRDFGAAVAQVDALKGMRRGRVRIGVLQYMNAHIVPDLVIDVNRQYPGLSFAIHSGNSPEMVDRVANGELDIALCWEPPASAPVRRVRTFAVPVGMVVPPAHEWAARKSMRFQECLNQPLILPTADMELRRMLDSLQRGSALRADAFVETNSIASMLQLVMAGAGAAVMTRVSVVREIATGSIAYVPLSDRGLKTLSLALLVRADRTLPAAAAMLLELLELRFDTYAGS